MSFGLLKSEVDEILYRFHRAIYYFEHIEAQKYGFTWQDFYLLRILESDIDYKMSELAVKLKLEKFQVTRLISKMEKKGFVYKKTQPNDKKSIYVKLTKEGQKMIFDTKQRHYDLIKLSLRDMDSQEIAIIAEFIRSMDNFLLPHDLFKDKK